MALVFMIYKYFYRRATAHNGGLRRTRSAYVGIVTTTAGRARATTGCAYFFARLSPDRGCPVYRRLSGQGFPAGSGLLRLDVQIGHTS
jgi:hypothetical protein